jgi:hypothetical protein
MNGLSIVTSQTRVELRQSQCDTALYEHTHKSSIVYSIEHNYNNNACRCRRFDCFEPYNVLISSFTIRYHTILARAAEAILSQLYIPLKEDLFRILLVLLALFLRKSHALEDLGLHRRATQSFGPQEGHFHRRFTPVVTVVAVTGRAPGHDLRFGQARQDAKNHGRARIQANIHNTLRHRIGNVFEMHGIALDEDAGTDDSVDGTR